MLEALKAFANVDEQQQKRDLFDLDEFSFKKLFRQLYTLADRYRQNVPPVGSDESEAYWKAFAADLTSVSNDWKLHDPTTGKEITDDRGCCVFHPLFLELATGIMDACVEISKAK